MAETFLTVCGNQEPPLQFTLQNDGTAIDLTNASRVDLIIASDNTGDVTNTGHQECTIVSPVTSGVVRYTQNAADCATEGRYIGEAKITYSGGRVQILHEQVVLIARPDLS